MPFFISLLLLAADAPTAAATADARIVAESGMLANVARLKTAAEIEELVAGHPELSQGEREALREAGQATAAQLLERAISAEAAAYAANLSAGELAALAAFAASDAAKAQRAAMPQVMKSTLAALGAAGEIDFKGDTITAFCAATGKLCGGQ